MAVKIMITDDHSMIREGLKSLLELDGDIEVIAEAENGEECLQKLLSVKPDVLLLDINMPKMNGLELLEQLQKHRVKINVIMVSTLAKEGAKETIIALERGAFDFVTKPENYLDAKEEHFKIVY